MITELQELTVEATNESGTKVLNGVDEEPKWTCSLEEGEDGVAVPKSQRGLSKMQYFKNATELVKIFTDLALCNFGIKSQKKTLEFMLPIAEKQLILLQLGDILNRTDPEKIKVIQNYPEWFWENTRKITLDLIILAKQYIINANAIYPNTPEAKELRNKYINAAVAAYLNTQDGLTLLMLQIPIDIQRLNLYVYLIDQEIFLLKRWARQSTNILKREVENISKNRNKNQKTK